jgi:hypothetical protein
MGTVAILIIVGSAATHWLVRGLSPPLYRRLDPATAGTLGFLIRLFAIAAVVILALRIAGVNAATLALGGAFTAIVLGLAAQQTLGGLFAGIDRGNRQLARPLLRDPGPGRRPAAGSEQRPHQPRRRPPA